MSEHKISDHVTADQLSAMLERLRMYAMGEIELSANQAKALVLLIDKTFPDLKPVSLEEAGIF